MEIGNIKGEPTNGDLARGGRINNIYVSGDFELIDLLKRAALAVYDVTCAECGCSYGHRDGCKNEHLAGQLREMAMLVELNLMKKGKPQDQQ